MANRRRIVITGVSRGLGRAMAEEFLARGHTVLGCCRSGETANKLNSQWSAPHAVDAVDVADAEQVAVWAERVVANGGPPDLLLNSAALINPNAPLWEVSVADFSQLVDVNIKGVFHVLRAFLPGMLQQGRGVIVNFSSGWGRSTSAEVAPYCATKWAVEGLTRALAEELPNGLAAVPLNPGVIHTDMLESCFGSSAAAFPHPEQWAQKAVPFLLELSAEHNGQPLTAPGA